MMHNDEPELQPLALAYANPITGAAWKVLQEAQKEHFFLDMASKLAEYDGYQFPETPEEVLWWFLDEARTQEEQGNAESDHPSGHYGQDGFYEGWEEIITAYQQAALLRRYAIELLQLGLTPVPPTKRGEK